jgi:hypothetical protein
MTKQGCWTAQYVEIRKAFPNEHPDRLLNAAFYHFLLTPDRFSVAQMLDQLSVGMSVKPGSRAGSLDYLLSSSASTVPPPHEIARQKLGDTAEHRRQLNGLVEHPLVQYYSWYTDKYLNAIALGSLIALVIFAWQPATAALGLSFVVASFTYLVMVSAVTMILAQYIAPVNFIMYVLTGFCLCMLISRLDEVRAPLADRMRAIWTPR